MQRRSRRTQLVVGLALIAGAATALPACGDEPGYFSPSQVQANVTYRPPADREVATGAEIVRRVGASLYAPLAEQAGDDNLAYSPLSIATVLGMVRAGAQGDSASELDRFFGAEAPHRELGGADDRLRSFDSPVQLDDGETMRQIEVNTANATWGQSGVTWRDPFLEVLAAGYDAPMWMADFTGDPDRARADINDWVASRTGERIDELLPDGSLTTDTRLVLTNAVYFSAPWPEPLDELSEWTFTTAAGDEVDVPMLGATGSFPYRRGDGWQAVTVPYAGRGLGMTFVLPEDLPTFEARLDEALLAEATTGGDEANVLVRLPAFDLAAEAELRPVLESLGVQAPFTTRRDFEPMTTDASAQPLWVDDVYHQATVAVDRFGTVATAATGAVVTTVGSPIVDLELNLTEPFLFVVHDLELGIPLFVGRVADPRGGG